MAAAVVIDENAFGVLISNHAVEDEEYGLERGAFVERFTLFRDTLRDFLARRSPGASVRALDLGHAVYVELADGSQAESPIAWARAARGLLGDLGFETVVAVTHGGRWVDEDDLTWPSAEALGEVGWVGASGPSEPLRRALYLDAASRADDADPDDDEETGEGRDFGWGPGLYLDIEVVEALGIKFRNEPTPLRLAGATFYRVGS